MIAIYVWNVGWVMGRKKGKSFQNLNVYTKSKAGAKPYKNEYDKEFIDACREAERNGHHIDKVYIAE